MTQHPLAPTLAAMRRKIQDEHEARRCLEAAERAGLTAGEWGRRHGIDGRSLNAWSYNLSRSKTVARLHASAPRMVELVPVAAPAAAARYLVRIGELSLEVSHDFDPDTLVRLVRALRAC